MTPERTALVLGLYRASAEISDEHLLEMGITRNEIIGLAIHHDCSLEEQQPQREIAWAVIKAAISAKRKSNKSAG